MCSSDLVGVNSAAGNSFIGGVDVRNVVIKGVCTVNGIILEGTLKNTLFQNIQTDGPIYISPTGSYENVRLLGCGTKGPSVPWNGVIYGAANTRIANTSPVEARLPRTVSSSTTANNPVLTYTLLGADHKYGGDQFKVRCVSDFGNTAGTKTVAINVFGTVYTLVVGAAADTGSATIATRDRKSTRLNSSHIPLSRMPSSA